MAYDDAQPKKPRRWRDKFHEAFRGTKRGIRGHSSFYVHFFFAAIVIALAVTLDCQWWEWCFLIGAIGFVMVAELFNSAIETLFHGLDEATKRRIHGCLDIAAGAVLIASLTAATVGGIIFARKFIALLS